MTALVVISTGKAFSFYLQIDKSACTNVFFPTLLNNLFVIPRNVETICVKRGIAEGQENILTGAEDCDVTLFQHTGIGHKNFELQIIFCDIVTSKTFSTQIIGQKMNQNVVHMTTFGAKKIKT